MLLGKVVYSVASLEGLLMFDLPRMTEPIAGLSPRDLAGDTTANIGRRLIALSSSVKDPDWRAYVERGGHALEAIGPRRNAVLHARPATIEGRQRLHRWRMRPAEVFSISKEHLIDLLEEIDAHRSELNQLRAALSR